MSWGVDIEVKHTDGYVSTFEVVDGHTYNLTPMWRAAGVVTGSTDELDGRTCVEMWPILIAGLDDAMKHPGMYEALNPANGWGDYDGFVKILHRLTAMCAEHSTGILRWNG